MLCKGTQKGNFSFGNKNKVALSSYFNKPFSQTMEYWENHSFIESQQRIEKLLQHPRSSVQLTCSVNNLISRFLRYHEEEPMISANQVLHKLQEEGWLERGGTEMWVGRLRKELGLQMRRLWTRTDFAVDEREE